MSTPLADEIPGKPHQECASLVRLLPVDESGDGQEPAIAIVHQAYVAELRLKSAERGGKGVAMRENTSFAGKNGRRIASSINTDAAKRKFR